ncbi:DUF1254 domain-containing protein [Nocardia neocaledoniensis]|uniref:DUF1254 domain-containing protein n=1 Tax=Nocardia neocaledoniensis TaxID=236511 RepID=UPI002458E0A7|nr:DUF1254 domain-containing protein [Nocardia neocaledoniensis]
MDGRAGGLSRRRMLGIGVAAGVGAMLPGCGGGEPLPSPARSTGPPDRVALAAEAYVFGYPMIMLDMMRAASAPTNTFDHSVLPDPLDRGVARLGHDMVYSQAWLDLSDQPLVLQLPGMEPDRFWLFQLLDGWGDTVHDLSREQPRTTVDAEGPPYTYVLVGPDWTGSVPPHTTQLHMPSNMATILGRIQINGAADGPRVNHWQQRIRLIPADAWQRREYDSTVSRVHQIDRGNEPPVKRIAALDGRTYLDRLCRLMVTDSPGAADAPLMERLAQIGVRPGGNVDTLSMDVLDEAVRRARRQIADWTDPTARHVNGWEIPVDRGTSGTDYLRRAATAMRSPGQAPIHDILYAELWAPTTDDTGRPRAYRIRFDQGQWPPTHAFASITAYDPEGFLVRNPAEIYTVGHAPPPVAGPDGAVDIVLQHEDPRPAVPTGNWLPIPATGDFSLTLRLYAPDERAIDGDWQPPPMTAR